MKRWLSGAIVFLVLFLGAYIALPWYSAVQLVDAAQRDNVEKLKRYVDFPALQTNIKRRLQEEWRASMGGDLPPELGGLFTAGSELILGPLVDRFVSPRGISDLIQGRRDWRELEKALEGKPGASPGTDTTPPTSAPDGKPEAENKDEERRQHWRLSRWYFRGLNLVVAESRNPAADTVVRLYLQRRGWHWQLVDLELIKDPSPEN